jgi:hypothetical protein
MDRRIAAESEFRTSIRWMFGILVTLSVTAVGMLGKALNLY